MIILDTDTLSISQDFDQPEAKVLQRRLAEAPTGTWIGSTIVTYEEQSRGWLAYVGRASDGHRRINAYLKLSKHLMYWRKTSALPYDAVAEAEFSKLRSLKIRIGTPDLKIAAIVLSRNGLLLSRNLRDFSLVPRLRVEDWTRE
jgi:tRNA(fMet)-specific endonuclease VapC